MPVETWNSSIWPATIINALIFICQLVFLYLWLSKKNNSHHHKPTEVTLRNDIHELERSNQELEHFAYVASHDLKAPLRAINNLSNWIIEDLKSGKSVESNFDMLKNRVQHMDRLIDGLFEYSKIGRQHTDKQIVLVSQLLTDMVAIITTGYDQKKVKINFPKNMPIVVVNCVRLEQIFTNLINNAIIHNEKYEVEIDISFEERADCYEFCVEDNGPGIDPRFHHQIFQIFQTLKPRTPRVPSTGIGLTLVKRIVQEFGGVIRIQSNLGSGSKFFFTIPK